MDTDNNNIGDDDASEEDFEQAFDLWSDDGARLFNAMTDEGSAYVAANPHLAGRFGEDSDGDEREYLYPDLCDPDEESL
jgi:hypothetical protein